MTRTELLAATAHPNVKAFLRAIRLGEGTSDERGYNRIVGGQEFEDFSRHPRVLVKIERYGIYSTAAGAYQFIYSTWAALCRQYGFADFSPKNQDAGAVALIHEKRALDDVKAGWIERAISKCASIWASLPGSTAGQRTEKLDDVLAEYVRHGGELAA